MTPEKRKCIDELGYGINTKLVLGYEGQPWRSKENNAMGYLFTKDMTNGWDASLNRTENNENGAYVAFSVASFRSRFVMNPREILCPHRNMFGVQCYQKRGSMGL